VDTTGVGDNYVLTYDSATSTWKAEAAAAGGEVSPVYGAELTRTLTNLAAASGTRTIVFDTIARQDPGLTVSAGKDSITVSAAGWYQVSGHARLATAVSGNHVLSIAVNGSTRVRGPQYNATTTEFSIEGALWLSAGDVVSLDVFTSGSSVIMATESGSYTRMTVVQLGGAEGPAGPQGPAGPAGPGTIDGGASETTYTTEETLDGGAP
jgi:hypothetical protein